MSKKGQEIIGFVPLVKKQELDFDPKVLTLTQIINSSNLPKVIQCEKSTIPSKEETNSIDISQPLLAYCKNSVRKVCAQNLSFDKKKKMFVTVGSDLLIPETYQGWFAVMGHPEECTSDLPVPHYRTLAQLATSQCSSFLVGGSKPIEGIMMDKVSGKNIRFQILPGEVLQKAGNYVAQYSQDDKKKKKKQKKKGKESSPQEEVYIKCYDHKDREIYVPACQQGMFFVVTQSSGSLKTQVLQMPALLERYKFPIIVSLIYGAIPKIPCAFTGTLLLTDSGMSHTVVTSTLFNVTNIHFEIPLSSDLKFRVAIDNPGLKSCKAYINALKSCENNAKSYTRNIKVIVGDPQLEDDESKSQQSANKVNLQEAKGNTELSEQTELRASLKGQKSGPKSVPFSRGSRKSTFKELSTCLTINDDTDIQGGATYSPSTLLFPSEELKSSPVLARHNVFDPPEHPDSIPIHTGAQNSSQLPSPLSQNHEYEPGTLKPEKSLSSEGNYIEIWKKGPELMPLPKAHLRLGADDYLIFPKYKEDIKTPVSHPQIQKSLSNPHVPIKRPPALDRRLSDYQRDSMEDEPLSPLQSKNDYINFVPQQFVGADDLTVERFSKIILEADEESLPPPIPIRKKFRSSNESDYMKFDPSVSVSNQQNSDKVNVSPVTSNPYETPDPISRGNVVYETPESIKGRKGSKREVDSNIADSGIYVEEDSKDENDNAASPYVCRNDYISMADAFPLLTRPNSLTESLHSPTAFNPDITDQSSEPGCNVSRVLKNVPTVPERNLSFAEARENIGKRKQLLNELVNAGIIVTKGLEGDIVSLQKDEWSQILNEKQNLEELLKTLLPRANKTDLKEIIRCVQNISH
ncbi:uncharacterized protein LOC106076746 [Biomphalaria glabrata]|uniref:Uncharacterized protein LOC106076746 n=1 Tax=Biomphalaria glabrata TaxID=6526 RepID=A0A9W3ADW8_BIOGL|nr:uncharacterized protein LOC106076746 [Biomphalaria glabrata]XP_055885325.1 uncharacterized protein LOC106076746 [Biomphalaria glabrata]XP_055885326.1 uncharacterized protein LOC106076746 [Biomphalaria glabrata]XP_055885327.1 uncharacterized protein LOC106076746 [Biomphalaria glabrata]XP_055885328.1 uncharacterized protein LOC106076746 [Biomphalaria glabrata]XP_055885329.1 uncharacterized protein LOC106076746 [Biomphalaria glabrata]XP_055885330.1 uncharacterized protein LOC106076746 [Biomph